MQRDLSARRIIGFACNQAFVFFVLFIGVAGIGGNALGVGDGAASGGSGALGALGAYGGGDSPIGRLGLLCLLSSMVAGFAIVRALGASRSVLFSRPLLYVYAVLAAAGLILPVAFPQTGEAAVAAEGVLAGVASSFLLTAWGRAFGRAPTETSVPEVFLGSLIGALVCLAFSLAADSPVAFAAVCLLPVASVVNIEVDPSARRAENDGSRSDPGSESPAQALSAKILAGTFLFGLAAGLMLLFRNPANGQALAPYQVSMVLFGAFLIGGLTLLLSDGFGRGAALNKSYRLAVFVMMVGVLLVPWSLPASSIMPGEALVLAGFLGLEAVLISLFLVLAEITGTDCAASFSTGFLALFAGELAGALAAGVLAPAPDAASVLAGAIVLVGYVFLFTERDFDALSQLVTESDSLERAQERIVERYGLSNRESEILAFALRGRTSERIAQELVISKNTVDTHLRRIYAKCGVHSRQELLDLAGQ